MPAPADAVVSYEVPCMCGRSLRGQRQACPQMLACPSCGRKRFILPLSPWLAPAPASAVGKAAHGKLVRLLLIIVGGATLAMTLIFLLARPYLRRLPEDGISIPPTRSHVLLVEGEHQLRDGNVFLALQQLNAALSQYNSHPQSLSRDEIHHLEQLQRQADLLARLLDQPLEEIIRQALQHHNDEEWNEKFRNYRGRSVVFDDVLRLDGQDRLVLGSYVVSVGGVEARVALDDLTLLRQLPLDPPRRWVFGARLASCRREQGGVWVFRFEPDSGVLLSDVIAAAACCPPPVDKDLLEVLKRQGDWLRR